MTDEVEYDNTVVVGDLHGKIEIAERVIDDHAFYDNIVFVGDYLDSYDRPWHECYMTLLFVLEAQKKYKNVTCLIGNHEWSYLDKRMRCSGYNWRLAYMLDKTGMNQRMRAELNYYLWLELNTPVLITHAGLSATCFGGTIIARQDIDEFLDSERVTDIGQARGGGAYTGGIFWCDYRREFESIPGIAQVFGHSRQRKGCDHDGYGNWCIDTLHSDVPQILHIKRDGTMSPIDL